jgi:hypothetical protein
VLVQVKDGYSRFENVHASEDGGAGIIAAEAAELLPAFR